MDTRPSSETKQSVLERVAATGKALSHPTRLSILELLSQRPRTVSELALATEVGMTTVSAHLQVLKDALLVETLRQGTSITYAVASSKVPHLLDALTAAAEPRAHGFVPADVPHVTRESIPPHATVIDVRPADEFHAGHIPGATSVPVAQIHDAYPAHASARHLGPIVAYCRGRTCVLGWSAVRYLVSAGYEAYVLCDGIVEWEASHDIPTPGLAS